MPEDKFKKIFQRNLLYYMKKSNKTQSDIVTDLGINKSAISTWCNGTRLPRMDKVDALARYFHIRRSDLIEEHSFDEEDAPAPISSDLMRIAKEMCRKDPVVLDVYDSDDREKLVDYASLLYGASSRHLAFAAHTDADRIPQEDLDLLDEE